MRRVGVIFALLCACARGPSEEALMRAYNENKETIQEIARSHLAMGWISPDNEAVLTTRYTRPPDRSACRVPGSRPEPAPPAPTAAARRLPDR